VSRPGRIALLFLYAIALALLTLTPSSDENPLRQSWIPLQSIWPTLVNLSSIARHPEYVKYVDKGGMIQIVGNLLLFVPFGWLVLRIFPQVSSTVRLVGLAAVVSLAIELTQLLFVAGRMASVDDVLLNAVSALIGVKTSDAFWRAVEGRHRPLEPTGR
jgi:glycopeptide antibiotics resistance protein